VQTFERIVVYLLIWIDIFIKKIINDANFLTNDVIILLKNNDVKETTHYTHIA